MMQCLPNGIFINGDMNIVLFLKQNSCIAEFHVA